MYNSNLSRTIATFRSDLQKEKTHQGQKQRARIDKTFYEVRSSVCVAGHYADALLDVKQKVASLMTRPCIESFHVTSSKDIKDGALLVPKVILVGVHCPGRKLIDEEGDLGQLDLLYDEVCESGADIMVIYVGLPTAIYPPARHSVYHPKVEEMLFPSQPILRHLASENAFITIGEHTKELTNMQKNVLREWLERPVKSDHPIYEAANKRISQENSEHKSAAEKWNRSVREQAMKQDQKSASENNKSQHRTTPKRKDKKRKNGGAKRWGTNPIRGDLSTLQEACEDDASIEMDNYRDFSASIGTSFANESTHML